MKKTGNMEKDTLKKEYDFDKLKGGVKGKYYKKYNKGNNIVLLEPEVAKIFPTDKDVNAALKLIIKTAKSSYKASN
ncbi:MAG: hypothetical protein PVH88_04995 [Ignavibacteria bacterium]|jgi:hypothetical protein